ncbi:dihydroorotate dehydrogenase electron transfer subunit [Candidatus Micrarchaeota archaeon]|nr:dihydroorotate dehydrogenase electron transfer subunit [Candidatus Micrarchaeota archaeon]
MSNNSNKKCCSSTFPQFTAKIKSVKEENYRIKTFELDYDLKAKPGQYALLWIPGVGERPMSIGLDNTFTVANVGGFSEALHKLKKGDKLSLRGPLGSEFELKKFKKIILVGGGYGVVPLYFLAKVACSKNISVTAVIAARKAEDIIFEEQFKKLGCIVLASTDDGSKGFRGNAVEAVKSLMQKNSYECIYTCGPEKMMYHLVLLAKEKEIESQVSIERYIKCGIGICGSCAINSHLVCVDGLVYSGDKALRFEEFGKSTRDGFGKKKVL